MWTIHSQYDPIFDSGASALEKPLKSAIITAEINLEALMQEPRHLQALKEGGREAMVALADFCARLVALSEFERDAGAIRVCVEPLDRSLRSKRRRNKKAPSNDIPYILERSDVYCLNDKLVCCVRAVAYTKHDVFDEKKTDTTNESTAEMLKEATLSFLSQTVDLSRGAHALKAMQHVACAILQNRMRETLRKMKVVSFIADGSILPRRSGASSQPMQSPPAVPFKAPSESRLSATIIVEGSRLSSSVSVDMGSLKSFLHVEFSSGESESSVVIPGMIVPEGITLIVGGGYHGKSTMLRTMAVGVYNKVPQDGREFCVSVSDAVCVRAEDGRYVNNCNVSAFISNLPAPKGVTSTLDTKKFSTREASGSTSQAANVSEAIEMGASALLVDEDVSAANFMARDGRMRALVADESITPLLYRVNGLYHAHGISSVVVVGGVGDWLDVPNNVILLDKYVASDATKKAESISRQFSYGHVQYAGRGVVHRLDWDNGGTPIPRRPTQDSIKNFQGTIGVSLVEGANMVAIESEQVETDGHEDDIGCIDMSRCEQLVAKKGQLFGCGLCVAWILKMSKSNPSLGIADLLSELEELFVSGGMALSLLPPADSTEDPTWANLVESVGFFYRPRKYEIYMALTRMRGISFEEMPIDGNNKEEATRLEAERKTQEQLDAWNARRKKNRFD
jgi:Predicted ATPase of the ABC class